MPQKRSAYKELRKGKKRHARNTATSSELKTLIKKMEQLISAGNVDEATKCLRAVSSKLHRAAKKNIIKKNTASRKISRFSKRLQKARKS